MIINNNIIKSKEVQNMRTIMILMLMSLVLTQKSGNVVDGFGGRSSLRSSTSASSRYYSSSKTSCN